MKTKKAGLYITCCSVSGNSHSFCSKQEGAKSGSRQKYYQFKEL